MARDPKYANSTYAPFFCAACKKKLYRRTCKCGFVDWHKAYTKRINGRSVSSAAAPAAAPPVPFVPDPRFHRLPKGYKPEGWFDSSNIL